MKSVPVKALLSSLCALVLLTLPNAAPGSAEDRTEISITGKDHFEAAVPVGSRMELHVRSGNIRIVGSEDGKLTVDISGKNRDKIDDLHYRLTNASGKSEFHLSGGPRNELTIEIRIPRNSDLYARIPAGDVAIENLKGSKDVELHAGDLTIHVGNPDDYSYVEASVGAGDISAAPFHEDHGGLFRSFHKSGPGKFTLHAHVGAGDLTLK